MLRCLLLAVMLLAAGAPAAEGAVSFTRAALAGESSIRPTSLQFGPDGRLYVAQQDGVIKAYTVARTGPGSYAVTATETIGSIAAMPNRSDLGAPATNVQGRLVT